MAGRGRELTLPAWMTNTGNGSNSLMENNSNMMATTGPILPPHPTIAMRPAPSAPSSFMNIPVPLPPPVFTHQPLTQMPNPQFAAPVLPLLPPTNPPGALFANPTPYPVMPQMPQMPRGPAMPLIPPMNSKSNSSVGDPNNDASFWSEHSSDTGRKYWYNRVSMLSTYDKPFCLKTPEERSIPPCTWKEYSSADGKVYYSNGTESTWTMPEEYRLWKEKVEAVERKKLETNHSRSAESNSHSNAAKDNSGKTKSAAPATPAIEYASPAEAMEAFKELLNSRKVSITAKFKEAQDLCQDDVRWDALKSVGDKKQAIAEYQTKKLKQEKEMQKVKARKHRDAFLLMLAENTEIDAHTRWRDAVELLQQDIRYKNVEDPREREDLFHDFVLELEKKEKEDRKKMKEKALVKLNAIIKEFDEQGKITRKSLWQDIKAEFAEALESPELRVLDDIDAKRAFQDYTSMLEDEFRKNEKKKKEERQKSLENQQNEFRKLLESMAQTGKLTANSRWKEIVTLSEVTSSNSFNQLCILAGSESDTNTNPSNNNATIGQDEPPKLNHNSNQHFYAREVFEVVLNKVQDTYRADKRLVKDLMHDAKMKIYHDSSLDSLKTMILRVGRLREIARKETGNTAEPVTQYVPIVDVQSVEEGEELDDDIPSDLATGGQPNNLNAVENHIAKEPLPDIKIGATVSQVRSMMIDRPNQLKQIFDELKEKAVLEYEEEERRIRKNEDRFISILEESFYLSDHVGIPWEDAKKILQKRSAYEWIPKSDRKRLFYAHMDELARKLEAKTKSMKNLMKVERNVETVEAMADSPRNRGESTLDHHKYPSDDKLAGKRSRDNQALPFKDDRGGVSDQRDDGREKRYEENYGKERYDSDRDEDDYSRDSRQDKEKKSKKSKHEKSHSSSYHRGQSIEETKKGHTSWKDSSSGHVEYGPHKE